MKINLQLNGNCPLGGDFLTLDPFPSPNSDGKVEAGPVDNLDWKLDSGEAHEIIAYDVLDFFPIDCKANIVKNWASKLAHNGRLTIGGADIYEISHAFAYDLIKLEDATVLFYGQPDFAYGNRRHSTTIDDMCKLLESLGLQIVYKRLQNCHYNIEAKRV